MTRLVAVIALAVAVGIALVVAVVVVRRLLIVVMPNELVVLFGRRHRAPDGRSIGFTVLTGGRTFRLPIVERAMRMPKGPFGGQVDLKEVFTRDGARLRIQGPAEIRISTDPGLITNAVERFVGRPPEEIARAAMETLEGHIRSAVATLEGERVVQDPLYFQQTLVAESDHDFGKLGLMVDSFTATARVQHLAPSEGEPATSAGQRLLGRLTDRDLSAEAKQAAVAATGGEPFTLLVEIERTNPPSLGELPDGYRDGQAAYGLAPNGLEVEVVFPAERAAEVELLEGGGLEVPLVVRALRWDGPRQCLVVLADRA